MLCCVVLSLQGKINKANRKIVAGERERDGGKGLLGACCGSFIVFE